MAKTPKAVDKRTDEQKAADKAKRAAEKRSKFVELGAKRVNAALEKIALIGNMSNRASYEYGVEDVEKIGKALNKAVADVLATFAPGGKKESGGFGF